MANTESVISCLRIDEIEKIQRSLRVIFSLQNLKLGHSDDAFHMFNVLFANASFLRILYEMGKTWKKMWNCVFINLKGCPWKLHLFASISFFRFSRLFGFQDIGRQNLKLVFFLSEVTPPIENHTEFAKKLIWSLKDKLFRDFNPVNEKKNLSEDKQGMSDDQIKKLTTLVVLRHRLDFWGSCKIWFRNSRSQHLIFASSA